MSNQKSNQASNSTPIITGVIEITGPHNTGKTTMALGCGVHPSDIVVFDNDINGRGRYEELRQNNIPLGDFIDLIKLRDDIIKDHRGTYRDEWLYTQIEKIIDDIPANKFKVAIIDTWPEIGKACRAYVEINPKLFKDKFAPNSSMANGQISDYGRRLEENLIARMITKFQLVVLISHLKDEYKGSVATGGSIPQSSKTLDKVCSMRVWLRHNPLSPVPIALFVKRPGKLEFEPGQGLVPVNMLPRKITPLPEDRSVWNSIRRYIANPIGNRQPTVDETPDEYELSILDGTLTSEQKMIMEYNLQQLIQEGKGQSGNPDLLFNPKLEEIVFPVYDLEAKVKEKVAEKINSGKSELAIALAIKAEVSKESGQDITLNQVKEMMNGL